MSFHDQLIVPPYYVQMDAENAISFLLLIGLLTFFNFAFSRVIECGGQKRNGDRMSYGNAAAA